IDDPTAYLYRTAMNIFRRRYRRGLLALKHLVALGPRPAEVAPAGERQTARRGLSALTPPQRAAPVLPGMLGVTPQEAAKRRGGRAAPGRALAFRGRAAFRSAMEAIDE